MPSRMSREGAARAYHMYIYWGYFNRRMSARRQLEQGTMPGSTPSTSSVTAFTNSKPQKSYYGEMTNVWRYFENVPDAISELRTREAAQVADRHARSACNPLSCIWLTFAELPDTSRLLLLSALFVLQMGCFLDCCMQHLHYTCHEAMMLYCCVYTHLSCGAWKLVLAIIFTPFITAGPCLETRRSASRL